MAYNYHQQPQHHIPNPYVPPPPHDPFRAYYADRLRELTFNSRPIIQDLSMQAMAQRDQHNWDAMKTVVEEIEAAVLRAQPQTKLPLLYLIDSISKNVGAPYTTHLLPPIMPRLYIKTYREVDGHTKSRMEEVIALWARSGPNGGELYPGGVRETVEREIYGSSGYQGPASRVPPGPTRNSVLELLNSTVLAKRREAGWNPTATQQLAVLTQIGELINTTNVSPQELTAIMEQLKGMNNAVQPPPNQPPITTPIPPNQPAYPPPADSYRSFQPPAQTPIPIPPPNPYPAIPVNIPRETYRSTPPPAISTPTYATPTLPAAPLAPVPSHPAPPASAIPANVADILRNLGATGFLSAPRTPDPIPKAEKPRTALDDYEDMVLGLDVKLTMIDINKPNQLPVSHLPQRCKQCGVRFPDGEEKMQAHMDWHFRRNRKERDSEGRGAHRRWLPRAEEWVKDIVEAGPSRPAAKPEVAGPSGGPSKLTAEKIAALRKKWVRVPSDPIKAAKPCPVCKESFKSEWAEAEEEWVYKNAVDVNGTIYHATCRAEQVSSALAAKLMKDENRRSKSRSPRITPQPEHASSKIISPGRPKADGSVKRKAEAGDEVEDNGKRVKVDTGVEGSGTEVGGEVPLPRSGLDVIGNSNPTPVIEGPMLQTEGLSGLA